jgi:hypothetical protein
LDEKFLFWIYLLFNLFGNMYSINWFKTFSLFFVVLVVVVVKLFLGCILEIWYFFFYFYCENLSIFYTTFWCHIVLDKRKSCFIDIVLRNKMRRKLLNVIAYREREREKNSCNSTIGQDLQSILVIISKIL